MKIGIIGAGQIGGTLTRRLTALGHEVFVANSRGPETLSDLVAETGATAVSVPEAVRGVDLVVVTIPENNIPSLPAGLFDDTPDQVSVQAAPVSTVSAANKPNRARPKGDPGAANRTVQCRLVSSWTRNTSLILSRSRTRPIEWDVLAGPIFAGPVEDTNRRQCVIRPNDPRWRFDRGLPRSLED